MTQTSNSSMVHINASKTIVHAIFINSRCGPIAINLSKEFNFAYEYDSKTLTINTASKVGLPDESVFSLGLASFHTVYGENGAGKTAALLKIAEAFRRRGGQKGIGVFFAERGALFVNYGDVLGGWTHQSQEEVTRTKTVPECASIFYTTSPFEFNRRRLLTSVDQRIDVSPGLGKTNYFDGLGLLRHAEKLPPAVTSNAVIKMKSNILSAQEIAVMLGQAFKESDPGQRAQLNIRGVFMRWFEKLSNLQRLEFQIAISVIHYKSSRGETQDEWAFELASIFPREPSPEHYPFVTSDEHFRRLHATVINAIERRLMRIINHGTMRRFTQFLNQVSGIEGNRRKSQFSVETLRKRLLDGDDETYSTAELCVDFGLLTFSISGLSSGETAYALLFSSIEGALTKLTREGNSRPIFLLIDEGEMFMHPRWQREYVSKLLTFVSTFERIAKNVHLIITTHSLIVAADSHPFSLVDVKNGVVKNGFGLGPKSTLDLIYGVSEFAGTHSAPILHKIQEYLTSASNDVHAARLVAEQLADVTIKKYVLEKLNRGPA